MKLNSVNASPTNYAAPNICFWLIQYSNTNNILWILHIYKSFYLAANCFHMSPTIHFWEVKEWGDLSLNGNRRIRPRESPMRYRNHTLHIMMPTRGTAHIHQCKYRWPKHARPSICFQLPSCWDRASSLTANLYTIILSPVLTRHFTLLVAECLWARTSLPLLPLVLCPHAGAGDRKGQMGKNKFPLVPSFTNTGCFLWNMWRYLTFLKIGETVLRVFFLTRWSMETTNSWEGSNGDNARWSGKSFDFYFCHWPVKRL